LLLDPPGVQVQQPVIGVRNRVPARPRPGQTARPRQQWPGRWHRERPAERQEVAAGQGDHRSSTGGTGDESVPTMSTARPHSLTNRARTPSPFCYTVTTFPGHDRPETGTGCPRMDAAFIRAALTTLDAWRTRSYQICTGSSPW
jgi:hypothetical protein